MVTIGASSRDQARICFERMRGFAQHPALDGQLTIRHLELRHEDGLLRVVPSDGPHIHGLSSTLYVADEVWSWPDAGGLLEAMVTGLVKRPDSKLLAISTAAAQLDSPLGRMRARALAQPNVQRRGPVVEATGDPHWIEWSLPEDGDLDDPRAVKRCNPAAWITVADLRRQRAAVPEISFAQFHACRWGVSEGCWLPAGAWQACVADCDAPGEDVWLGVDIGGSRAATAVVGVTADLRVCEVHIRQGDESVMEAVAIIHAIAKRRRIRELAHDPWRFRSEALRLEGEHGLTVVQFPQSYSRMTVASEGLHAAIVEKRLKHPGHPGLDRHVAQAIAKKTGRGWRLDKSTRSAQIDSVIALAMSVERAQAPTPPPARVLGWV